MFGKPRPEVYALAEASLREQSERLGRGEPLRIMAIGDNAHVDVRGANRAGWSSALVLTGVHQPGDEASLAPEDTPAYTHADVLDVLRVHAGSYM